MKRAARPSGKPEKSARPAHREKKPSTEVVEEKPVLKRKVEEEDFPRGGDIGLTPLEYREVVRQAQEDLLKDDVRVLLCIIYPSF